MIQANIQRKYKTNPNCFSVISILKYIYVTEISDSELSQQKVYAVKPIKTSLLLERKEYAKNFS